MSHDFVPVGRDYECRRCGIDPLRQDVDGDVCPYRDSPLPVVKRKRPSLGTRFRRWLCAHGFHDTLYDHIECGVFKRTCRHCGASCGFTMVG